MILLEDCGALLGLLFALIGVVLSVITGNGVFDGISTLCIGALLVTVAVLLAVETKSLIVGESALPEELATMEAALLSTPGAGRVIHMRTMHLGPDELLLAAKIGVDEGAEIAATIDEAEARVRAALPTAEVIYLEPTSTVPSPRRRRRRPRTPPGTDRSGPVQAGNHSWLLSIS
ncbi:hypothetical protein GCM10020358_49550 [Amorphoplanes nipponensis]|uniref:Cation diffusion facilitator family transporter n=1 Tax=Actinoplanes nipponensis TaxID=135950 RepID=A0A919MXC5_9ACTN|nr:hypothetical protein [Actinoplanes nipponensis]GIE53120.1 hypothetical protein Ani05nite_66540 [Actinoplanes nipponensis]